MCLLSMVLMAGRGGPMDRQGAVAWLERARALGSNEAPRRLAVYHLDGKLVPSDRKEAFRLLHEAIRSGNPWARLDLGDAILTEEGEGGKPERARIEVASAEYVKALDGPCEGEAALRIGRLHARGVLGAIDWVEARRWFRRSVDRGAAAAMVELARCLQEGKGGAVDLAGAHALFLDAARRGEHPAMLAVGENLYGGRGVPRDVAAARRWLERASEAGNQEARWVLSSPGFFPAREAR